MFSKDTQQFNFIKHNVSHGNIIEKVWQLISLFKNNCNLEHFIFVKCLIQTIPKSLHVF